MSAGILSIWLIAVFLFSIVAFWRVRRPEARILRVLCKLGESSITIRKKGKSLSPPPGKKWILIRTNAADYLRDTTGSKRYWTVNVKPGCSRGPSYTRAGDRRDDGQEME